MAKKIELKNPREQEEVNSVNLRLPYGIAKGLGLSTDGMTPSQVWNMLKGYGMKPKEEYEKFWNNLEKDQKIALKDKAEYEIINQVEADSESEKPESPFTEDAYSEDRKKNAVNSTDPKVFDQMARVDTYKTWQTLSNDQKSSIVDYTGNYSKFNEPLRGIEYGTNVYKGVGNIDLENIGVGISYKQFKKGEVKKKIDDLTSAIEKSSYSKDCILRRGCNYNNMDKFFAGISEYDLRYATTEDLQSKMVGKTYTDHGFTSCGSTKGKGFDSKNIKMSIYAPKGTKMMYVEPVSKFGNGVQGTNWQGQEQQSFSYEDETVIQRGTSYKVTEVKRLSSGLYIRMEVVGQQKF